MPRNKMTGVIVMYTGSLSNRSRTILLAWVLPLLLLWGMIYTPPAAEAAVTGYVTRSGNQLQLDGQPFRFSSANIYWLGLDENVPTNGTIDFPTNFRVDDALATAKEMGATVVRSHLVNSFGCAKCIMPTLGNYNEAAWQKVDYAIKAAGDQGIRLILPVIDMYNYYHGGKKTWTKWYGYPDDGVIYTGYEFFSDANIITAFKQHLSVMLNRVNTYTGVAYKNDPTILAWETGNELGWYDNPTQLKNWTQQIADYLKQQDANHLVADGNYGIADAHLTISSIDMYSDHFYTWGNKGLSVPVLQTQANKVRNAGKVMFVGEYDWKSEQFGTLAAFHTAIENDSVIAGDMYWALFGHNDNYGYVQHPDGYTVHYPGDTTFMRTQAQQMRNHAYKMRGITTPPAHGIPGAPTITGSTTSGGKYVLNWRGSVPSDTYTVERSTAGSSGPWTVACNQCVTDNQTPWTDTGSTAGAATWYRVKGHNLSGTAGAYSAVYAISGTQLQAPGSFTQSAPASGATSVNVTPSFTWGTATNAATYTLVVADNTSYSNPVINVSGLTSTSYTPSSVLTNNKTYYWKVTAVNSTGSTNASNSGIAFTTVALPAPTSTVDNFDGYASDAALQAAYVKNASGNTFTMTREATTKDAGAYGAKIVYTVNATTSYAGAVHTLGNANWTGNTSFNLWVKPDGSNRTLTIQFKETNGELWETYYTLAGTTATTLSIPFTSFQHPGWYSGGNGVIDLGSIGESNLYINKGSGADGSGTIYVDSISLGNGSTPPPPTTVIIDNYESYGGSNPSVLAAYVRNTDGNAITPTLDGTNKSQGSYGLKLAYTMGTPNFAGVVHSISQNWSGKTGIQLWLKPDGSNRTLTIQFKEPNGEPWETTYTLSSTTSGTIQLPFTAFQHPPWYSGGNGTKDLSSISEFNLYVNQGSGGTGSSTIYVDDIQAY